jgi:hypothetical protein
MFRKFLKVSLVISIVLLAGFIAGYGLNHNRNFDYYALTQEIVLLFNMTLDFWRPLIQPVIGSFDFSGIMNLSGTGNWIIVGGTAFGVFIGLIALVRGFIVRRPLAGLIAMLASIDLFAFGLSLIIVNPSFPRGRFLYVLQDGFTTDFNDTLLKVGMLAFTFLSLLLIFELGSSARRRRKVIIVTSTTQTLSSPITQPSFQPQSAPALPTNDALSDLVKAVMQEELNLMKSSQQNSPNQANPYTSGTDVQMIRQIVAEEIAKFQNQFMSRAEAQSLIAKEISLIKSQLKLS